MTSVGFVRSFDAAEGWGVIDGPDVPGGCWVHFSALAMAGYRTLAAGQRVSFRAEAASQDGFAFRAVKVWTTGSEPPEQEAATALSTRGSGAPFPTLTGRRSPWVVFTRAGDPWLSREAAELSRRGGRVVRLDGRELREPASLFAAFARELSFPDYFGRNWDALVDCLHDWHGHGTHTNDIAILVDRADELLGAAFLGIFVSALCEAAWKANLQLDADGQPHEDRDPFALHVVFLLDDTAPAAFADGVASGADVGVAFVQGRLTATLTSPDWPGADPVTPFRRHLPAR